MRISSQALRSRVWMALLNVCLLAWIIVVHGLIPGVFFPSMGATPTVVGLGHSLALGSFWSYPAHFGHPLGSPILLDLPFVYVEALLIRLLKQPLNSYLIGTWPFLIVAFFGCRSLLKRFGVSSIFASIGSAAYLTSTYVMSEQGLPPIVLGFALLPTSVAIDIALRDEWIRSPRRIKWLVLLVLVCVLWRVVLLFTDGYSFTIAGVFGLCLASASLVSWQKSSPVTKLSYILSVAVSFVIPYLLYTAYVPPGTSYRSMGADVYRGQGIDLATFILPLNAPTQLSSLFPFRLHYSASQFYGVGFNAFANYLGIALPLAIYGAILIYRTKRPLLPIMAAAFICLVLSLGPSLKIMSIRPQGQPQVRPGYNDFAMPRGASALDLHTDAFYTKTPVIRVMRAVYRWSIGFKLIVLTLACVSISAINARGFVITSTCLSLLLLLDSVSQIRPRFKSYSGFNKAIHSFYADVTPEMRQLIPRGSVILFVSGENDFLADPIAAELDVRSYNVGGDKNQELAIKKWPPEVKQVLIAHKDVIEAAKQLHAQGKLDFLIFPHFNLRWHSYWWPPGPNEVEKLKRSAKQVIDHSDLNGVVVVEGKYSTILSFTNSATRSE